MASDEWRVAREEKGEIGNWKIETGNSGREWDGARTELRGNGVSQGGESGPGGEEQGLEIHLFFLRI